MEAAAGTRCATAEDDHGGWAKCARYGTSERRRAADRRPYRVPQSTREDPYLAETYHVQLYRQQRLDDLRLSGQYPRPRDGLASHATRLEICVRRTPRYQFHQPARPETPDHTG